MRSKNFLILMSALLTLILFATYIFFGEQLRFFRWVLVGGIIIGLVYFMNFVFDLLTVDRKFFGFVLPWKDLSRTKKIVRNLTVGLPIVLVLSWLSNSPIIFFGGLIIIIGDTVRLLRESD